MNGEIDILTLLSLVLAVVVFLILRNVLGRKTGNEGTRYDPYMSSDQDKTGDKAGQDNVISLPRRGHEDGDVATQSEVSYEEQEKEIKKFSKEKSLSEGLVAIFRVDRSFKPEEFIQGAKTAYEMIVSSFAEGNRKALKGLLSSDVYDGFVGAITEREKRGETVDQNFVGISRAKILEANMESNSAQIKIKFVSELISATMDRAGTLISGDPNSISEVTDVWTFAREAGSHDPNWKLIATQAAG